LLYDTHIYKLRNWDGEEVCQLSCVEATYLTQDFSCDTRKMTGRRWVSGTKRLSDVYRRMTDMDYRP
jgi:hypothetical protein